MRKITLVAFAIVMLAMLTSCGELYFRTEETKVSNLGTTTSSVTDGKTTITVEFGKSQSGEYKIVDKTMITTVDTGRYDTLVKLFKDYSLTDGKKYYCTVSGTQIKYIEKTSDGFVISDGQVKCDTINARSKTTFIDKKCTLSIKYGGEQIVDYSSLPISPTGLPSGALWNDNGTIKIVK